MGEVRAAATQDVSREDLALHEVGRLLTEQQQETEALRAQLLALEKT